MFVENAVSMFVFGLAVLAVFNSGIYLIYKTYRAFKESQPFPDYLPPECYDCDEHEKLNMCSSCNVWQNFKQEGAVDKDALLNNLIQAEQAALLVMELDSCVRCKEPLDSEDKTFCLSCQVDNAILNLVPERVSVAFNKSTEIPVLVRHVCNCGKVIPNNIDLCGDCRAC